jgi:uncharacterized protein YndB with AHSA1/START domain
MAGKKKAPGDPGMSDAAVAAKTGKNWAEWVRTLDKAGAARMTHREIAACLYDKLGVPSWWAQMVTVGYERLRHRRKRHEKPEGYDVGASRTVPVPIARLFAAWNDLQKRRRWLRKDEMEISTARRNKSLRVRWGDGDSRVEILFYAKGSGKSSVTVDHRRLQSAKEAAKRKSYWVKQLDALEKYLAG